MQIFGIHIENRDEKRETLKRVIHALSISSEEKDIYILSLDILDDTDFNTFFERIMSQIHGGKMIRDYSIEPLTSKII